MRHPRRRGPTGAKVWVLQYWWAKPRGLGKGMGIQAWLARQTHQSRKTGRHHPEATAPVHPPGCPLPQSPEEEGNVPRISEISRAEQCQSQGPLPCLLAPWA